MNRSFRWYFFLLLLPFLPACNNQVQNIDIGYTYFPTELGRYYVYQVDSVFVDCQFGVRDTFHYQVKEYFDTLFTDLEGDPAIRIERYKRTDALDAWSISDVWSVKKLSARVEKVEENVRYVKLTFPILQGAAWDGNAYNYITNWGYDYTYDEPDVALTVGPYSFDSTVTVFQKVDSSLIYKRYYTETFARNVGMIKKVIIDINGIVDLPEPSQDCDELLNGQLWTNVPIMNRIKSGAVVYYTLIDYGFE